LFYAKIGLVVNMEIEFYKNDKLINIDPSGITISLDNLTIKKENEENIIILDFKNKKCFFTMKAENIELQIPVISMEHCIKTHEKSHFIYVLESEPEVINKILI